MSAVAAIGLALAAVAAAGATPPTPLFRYLDPAITESSGLAVSSYDDRVVFTHNDSGDAARFFAVDAATGRTLAAYRLPGATNVDWEDVAAAPDEAASPALWFADIGDNRGRRTEVVLYRVAEPRVSLDRSPGTANTGPPRRYRLRYPDGPHDAEALVVDPRRGGVYVATKSLSGRTAVYSVPSPLRPGPPAVLRLVATVELGLGAAVTGAAVAPAGDRVVLRTYSTAYAWPLGADGVPAALRSPPIEVALPAMPQGESVAFRSDGALLVGSEGRHSPVYVVRLPALAPAATSTRAGERSPAGGAPSRRGPERAVLLTGAGGAAVLVGWALLRRRRAHPPRRTSRGA